MLEKLRGVVSLGRHMKGHRFGGGSQREGFRRAMAEGAEEVRRSRLVTTENTGLDILMN